MDFDQYIPFLKTFGLIVFDLFFFIMIIVSLYSVFILTRLKKHATSVLITIESLVENTKKETNEIAQLFKEKAETLNLSNIAIIGSLIGGIFMPEKKFFSKKSISSTILTNLLKLLK
jgi:hypothetical protein